jgi:hypothetical protein
MLFLRAPSWFKQFFFALYIVSTTRNRARPLIIWS